MSCTGVKSFKAKDRLMKIQIEPKEGSKPTFIALGMRILDRAKPPGPTITRQFSASQLKTGVGEKLVPAKRYDMLLTTAPEGTELVVTITFDDGTKFVEGETCIRGSDPVTGDWSVTTWRE